MSTSLLDLLLAYKPEDKTEREDLERMLAFVQEQPEIRYAYAINGTNVHFDIPKGKR